MGDEHPLSDDGRDIACPGLESAAPGLAGEGSGTIHLRRGNTTAGLDQGQFRASAYSRVTRFRSFSADAGECGLLSQASGMVADLGADSVSYCFPSQPRRKSLCNCVNSLADARAAAHRKTGVLRRPMAPPPGSSPGQALLPNGRRNHVLPERRAALSLSTIIGSFVAC